ncbi:hypothetical protein GN956_G22022 [Arapaima gigas]
MAYRLTFLWSFLVVLLCPVASDVFYALEGKEVKMPCGEESRRQYFRWLFEDTLIYSDEKSGSRRGAGQLAQRSNVRSGTLTVSKLQSSDAGKYKCVVNDLENVHQLHVVTVSIIPSGPLLQSTNLQLSCTVKSNPTANITWIHPKGRQLQSTTKGAVSVSSVTLSDDGMWICQIQENKKLFRNDVQIKVLGLIPNTNLSVNQGASVLLPCALSSSLSSPPFNIFQLDKIVWQNRKDADTFVMSKQEGKPEFFVKKPNKEWEVGDLKQDKNFSVILKNVKKAQSGGYTCTVFFKSNDSLTLEVNLEVTGDDPGIHPETSDNQKNPWISERLTIWIYLALGCGLLVVFIIVGVVLHRRKKRTKKEKRRKLKAMATREYCKCNRVETDRPNGSVKEGTSGRRGQHGHEDR